MKQQLGLFLSIILIVLVFQIFFTLSITLMQHRENQIRQTIETLYEYKLVLQNIFSSEQNAYSFSELFQHNLDALITDEQSLKYWERAKSILRAYNSDSSISSHNDSEIKVNIEIQSLLKWYKTQFTKIRKGISTLFHFFALLNMGAIILIFLSLRSRFQKTTVKSLTEVYEKKMIYQLEQERNLLAYFLHDEIAQSLVFIKTYLESPNQEYIEKKKNKALYLTTEVLESIRDLSHSLRAPTLKEGNFNDILRVLCQDMNSYTSMELHYNFLGTSKLSLEEDQFLHIYRITQELLNNGIKHAEGSRMDIRFLRSYPLLIIQYNDDGIGFKDMDMKTPSHRGSLGMTGIEYRCKLLGATMHYRTGVNGGALVRIEIPLEDEEEDEENINS